MCDEIGAAAAGVPDQDGFGVEPANVRTIVVDTPAALLGLPRFEG